MEELLVERHLEYIWEIAEREQSFMAEGRRRMEAYGKWTCRDEIGTGDAKAWEP